MRYALKFSGGGQAAAEGKYDGGVLRLTYALDGVRYLLNVSQNKVEHLTVGDGLNLVFIQGQRTCGKLNLGGRSADYPIFCRELSVTLSQSGCNVRVRFNADGQESGEDSPVQFTAELKK